MSVKRSSRNTRVIFSPSLPSIITDQQNRLQSLGGRVDIAGKHQPVSYGFDVGQLEKKRARVVHRTAQIQFLHLLERTRDRNSNGRLARKEGHQHDTWITTPSRRVSLQTLRGGRKSMAPAWLEVPPLV